MWLGLASLALGSFLSPGAGPEVREVVRHVGGEDGLDEDPPRLREVPVGKLAEDLRTAWPLDHKLAHDPSRVETVEKVYSVS